MSIKSHSGQTFARFTSECEKLLKTIDERARSKRNGAECIHCGATDVLWMTGAGYVCDDHRKRPEDSYHAINKTGRVWTF